MESGGEDEERQVTYRTLIRLANSCDRAAARGGTVTSLAADLNHDDYRDIADILRRLAATIDEDGR